MNQPGPTAPAKFPVRGLVMGGLILGVILGLIALFQFNPTEHRFFPRCVFHIVSGWDCPGCGGQRALHYLLHGNVGAALRHNALLVALLPVGGWLLARSIWGHWSKRALPALFNHHAWAWILCVLVIGFALVRNLPGFGWLRP